MIIKELLYGINLLSDKKFELLKATGILSSTYSCHFYGKANGYCGEGCIIVLGKD